jgi:excinuclease ABC subunit B
MEDLRRGLFDVLIGVNLLREGLDFPQVSLVAVLDADKEGFLRSERSLVQTVGRAARNINGMGIFYADQITNSMQKTIAETERRRKIQSKYNQDNNITPKAIVKEESKAFKDRHAEDLRINQEKKELDETKLNLLTPIQLDDRIKEIRKKMEKSAKNLDFIDAARYRDLLSNLQKAKRERSL